MSLHQTEPQIRISKAIDFLTDADQEEVQLRERQAFRKAQRAFLGKITFTSNVFLPLTFLCRNKCTYCGYRRSSVSLGAEYVPKNKIKNLFERAKQSSISEVLITMGEKPELVHSEAKKWLNNHSYDSTVDYAFDIAELALKQGLLPHINAGVLSSEELQILKEVSASMGLMLENISSRLCMAKMPHAESPGKHPKIRLDTIKSAGRLSIPFTSGLLIGIGESPKEIVSSLYSLSSMHRKFQHIQEIIIQAFQPNEQSKMDYEHLVSIEYLKRVVILAKLILPEDISVQIPPNLIEGCEIDFMQAGISDWGGISPFTKDYINPHHPWPRIDELRRKVNHFGFELVERLPVYPQYINSKWLSSKVEDTIHRFHLCSKDGYRKR
ncbi:MAG: 7,8-didemethyl-8-hydroxy-5-deazariboflavin synthase subunit CofG [Candidatus Heimdallarchaeota archaeon]|nr:7,8-didemethyl-8-hydroxy-5-deazariboflavin synthase subunit CofG [Candidatus Heimdallarchaeota archaeon]